MTFHNPALNAQPRSQTPDIGVEHAPLVAGALSDVLADTYLLMLKTHAHHWNVSGPLFYSIHQLTETQYENMFEAADEMAERVRALGALAPSNAAEMLERSALDNARPDASAGAMVAELVANHEQVARRLHKLAGAAGDANDIVTEDLAVQRSAFHEKAAWMLRALITE